MEILDVGPFSLTATAALELPSSSTEDVNSTLSPLTSGAPREVLIRGFSDKILFSALSRFRLYIGVCRGSTTSATFRGICGGCGGSNDFVRRPMVGGLESISSNFRRLLRVP